MNERQQAEADAGSSYDAISYTAMKVLEKRALRTSIPYAREMADAAGVQWRISRARAWAQEWAWGRVRAGYYLQVRHDAISSALSSQPASPVLELGAGYGTRGMAEAPKREVYIESDLPTVIARKPSLVETTLDRKPSRNHHFIAFNACSVSDAQAVRTFVLALHLRQPLAIVNEGILMYLDDDEQRALRDNVRMLLSRCAPSGAWITTDFSERDHQVYKGTMVQRWMTRRLTRRLKRPFNRFRSDDDVHAFLAEGGLRGSKLASVACQHPDEEIRDVADAFRAWRITLDSVAANPGT